MAVPLPIAPRSAASMREVGNDILEYTTTLLRGGGALQNIAMLQMGKILRCNTALLLLEGNGEGNYMVTMALRARPGWLCFTVVKWLSIVHYHNSGGRR